MGAKPRRQPTPQPNWIPATDFQRVLARGSVGPEIDPHPELTRPLLERGPVSVEFEFVAEPGGEQAEYFVYDDGSREKLPPGTNYCGWVMMYGVCARAFEKVMGYPLSSAQGEKSPESETEY